MKILLENGRAYKLVKNEKGELVRVRITMPDYRAELKRQRAAVRAAKPAKKVAPKKKKAAKKVKAAEKPKSAKKTAARKVQSTSDRRRVTSGQRTAGAKIQEMRGTIKGLKSVAGKASLGAKAGYGAVGGIAALILSSMLGGGGEKAKQPELPMGLLQMAGAQGGQNTSKTLMDIARLISILKGAQGLAGAVAPPPLARVENQNPFSAAGLVA